MNEEVGFITALLAEPNDRTTLLVYADWLDERGDPRAAYVRRLVTDATWPPRDASIDLGWVMLLRSRLFGPGCRVKWDGEPPESIFDFTTITANRRGATVCLTIRRRSRELDFGWWELEINKR